VTFLRKIWDVSSRFHFFAFRNSFLQSGVSDLASNIQPPTWRTVSLYLHPPVTGYPSCILRHQVPFSLPSAIRRTSTRNYRKPCES
jgi:hypothetical protein